MNLYIVLIPKVIFVSLFVQLIVILTITNSNHKIITLYSCIYFSTTIIKDKCCSQTAKRTEIKLHFLLYIIEILEIQNPEDHMFRLHSCNPSSTFARFTTLFIGRITQTIDMTEYICSLFISEFSSWHAISP